MTDLTPRSIVLVLLALALPVAGARASHFDGACSSELNAVEQAIDDAVFLGRNASTNESNLLAKLEAANAKVGREKFDDAVDKLQDISDAATAWANAVKPKLEDATAINSAVADAIACVAGL